MEVVMSRFDLLNLIGTFFLKKMFQIIIHTTQWRISDFSEREAATVESTI